MRRWRKGLVVSVMAAGVLVPGGVAVAATTGTTGSPTTTTAPVCNGDHQMLRLHDGTGWRHTTADGTMMTVQPGAGYQHRSGPQDGTGPMADRPMDGTGQQWGRR